MAREYPLLVRKLTTHSICIKLQKPPKPFKQKLKKWFHGLKHDFWFVKPSLNYMLKEMDAG